MKKYLYGIVRRTCGRDTTDANKELFTQVTGGVQFDIFDVSKTFAIAFAQNGKLNLNDAKGYKEYFAAYLSDNPHAFFTPAERSLIAAGMPYLRDWLMGEVANDMVYENQFKGRAA